MTNRVFEKYTTYTSNVSSSRDGCGGAVWRITMQVRPPCLLPPRVYRKYDMSYPTSDLD